MNKKRKNINLSREEVVRSLDLLLSSCTGPNLEYLQEVIILDYKGGSEDIQDLITFLNNTLEKMSEQSN